MSLLIIDSNNILHRALYSPEYFSTEYLGNFTGGVLGFLEYTRDIIASSSKNTKLICVWDGQRSVRCSEYYKEYKRNRDPKTEQDILIKKEHFKKFNDQKNILCKELISNLPILSYQDDLHEADHVIYQICRLHSTEDITVVSEDKDLLQLINMFDNLKVFRPIKKEMVTKQNFKEITGVSLKAFLIYKAMLGDDSDNIPGPDGVGAKTAIKMANLIDDERPYESLVEVSKTFHDADIEKCKKKPEVKYKRESLVYNGLGVVARNLELMDLSREEFKNITMYNLAVKLFEFKAELNEINLIQTFHRYGFRNIIQQYNFWIQPFKNRSYK